MKTRTKFLKSGILIPLLFLATNLFALKSSLYTGVWRGVLQLNDTTELPFNFEIKQPNERLLIEIINGTERISVTEINFIFDSVIIKLPVFDSEFRCKNYGDSLKGVWINHNRKDKNRIPFSAHSGNKQRFIIKYWTNYEPNVQGTWEATFAPNTKDPDKAIGKFFQTNVVEGSKLTGTFATESGDYRYLEGIQANNRFLLSCFDGSHAFLFTATLRNDSLVNGRFYSGAHSHQTWVAVRNEKFQLRNPDSLTYLKAGYDKINFSFKNLEGKTVSLSDEKYKNKVVIVQLMGSWCPNCMDETKFFASLYNEEKNKGLEIIALAFERTDDFAKAVEKVSRVKNKFNAKYDFLITMKTGANQASEALPMLNNVMAFPTTIYIDKKGNVKKIYTGFYGPATGESYTHYVSETSTLIEKMLGE